MMQARTDRAARLRRGARRQSCCSVTASGRATPARQLSPLSRGHDDMSVTPTPGSHQFCSTPADDSSSCVHLAPLLGGTGGAMRHHTACTDAGFLQQLLTRLREIDKVLPG